VSFQPDHAAQRWLQDRWRDLVEEHLHQWVVATGDGVIASHEDLDAALEEALTNGAVRLDDLALGFVDGQELEARQPLD
jgi:hypothetical protein